MICSNETQQLSEADRQNFHELYLKYQRRVYSTCFRMTQNSEESEDLTQEVFIHLFRTIGSFRGDSAFTTWLHRLTVNHVLMHFRKRRTRREMTSVDGELPIQIAVGTNNPNRMNVTDRILLSEVMAKLPNGYREAVVLHDIEGHDHYEIAAMKGRSAGTSKSQLHKARIVLRRLITQSKHHPDVNRHSLRSMA